MTLLTRALSLMPLCVPGARSARAEDPGTIPAIQEDFVNVC